MMVSRYELEIDDAVLLSFIVYIVVSSLFVCALVAIPFSHPSRRILRAESVMPMLFLLCVGLSWFALSSAFHTHSIFPHATIHNSTAFFHDLASYTRLHSRDAIIADGSRICDRVFSVAVYTAPEHMGNRMHEFLNAFVASYVSNRTVLWEYCTRKPCQQNPYDYCHTLLSRLPWMMHVDEARALWKQHSCSGSFDTFPLFDPIHHVYAEEVAMCCQLDNVSLPVIHYGTQELHEFYSLSLPNALLKPENKIRAEHLFQHGEHFAYGALFKSAFKFAKNIIDDNTFALHYHLKSLQQNQSHFQHALAKTVEQAEDAFYIAVHLRHATNDDTKDLQDVTGMQCFQQLMAQHRELWHNRLCVVLLAADRQQSLHYWQARERELNCSVLVSNHSDAHFEWTEHGPFTGEIAVRDVELLSRGDLFIGSTYLMQRLRTWASSFSLLAAELRAVNGRPLAMRIPPVFIPDCADVLAGRKVQVSKDIFAEPRETSGCVRSLMKYVPIPAHCTGVINELK